MISAKIDKCEYHAEEKVLPSDQSRIIEQAKLTFSPLCKALEKQTKTIENKEEKQIKASENKVAKKITDTDKKSVVSSFSKYFLNEEDTYESKKLVGMENNLNRDGLIYEVGNKKKDKTYDFQKFKTIRSVGREIYCNLPLDDAFEKQIRLKNDIDIFKESTKPEKSVKK